ncbi:MAG: hypothetical protein WHU10_12150, partial [Fimbriimonadales bacterium]
MNQEDTSMPPPTTNGRTAVAGDPDDASEPVRARRMKLIEQRLEFDRETKQQLAVYREELDRLHTEHRQLMDAAADFAGNLGLKYDPEKNSIEQVVVFGPDVPKPFEPPLGIALAEEAAQPYYGPKEEDEESREPKDSGVASEATEAEETPAAVVEAPAAEDQPPQEAGQPAGVEPALPQHEAIQPPAPTPTPEPPTPPIRKEKALPYRDWVSWVLLLGAGSFIGIGIGKLTGLEAKLGPSGPWVFGVLGVMLLAGVKVLLGSAWYPHGRRAALGRPAFWTLLVALFMTLLFVAAEVTLGAVALNQYILNTAIDDSEHLPIALLAFVALCVSAPVLLGEGVAKYWRGYASVSEEERRYALEEKRYQEALEQARRREEEDAKRRQEEERRREEEHRLRLDLLRQTQEKELQILEESRSKDQELAREQAAQAAQRLEEAKQRQNQDREKLEGYRNRPDFQALMSTLSRIENCRMEIRRVEREAAHYAKARGY